MDPFTILCPTDFSECSLNAIEYAAKLGEKFEANLVIFHVPDREDYAKLFSKNAEEENFLMFARIKLENLVSEVEKESMPHGLKSCVGIIQEGKTVNTIVEYADRHAVELIVM